MADKWLVDENIDVDIQQLKDFADAIRKEVDTNFQPSFARGVAPMLRAQAPFGQSGMAEAAFFRERHELSRQALSELTADVMKGLTALSTAALSISLEYLTGDALAQATNDDVLKAFEVTDALGASDESRKAEADPGAAIPDEVLDQNRDFGDQSSEPTQVPNLHETDTIGEGTGAYVIPADDEGMHDPELEFDRSDVE